MIENILNGLLYLVVTPVVIVFMTVVPISLFFNAVAWVDAKRAERFQRKRNANVNPR